MERLWKLKNKKALFCLHIMMLAFTPSTQAALEGYDDNTWADIGNEFSVKQKDIGQKRSFSDINDAEGLLTIGAFIKLSQDINLRKSPGGPKIKPVLEGDIYQILGVHVKRNGRRYYKIKDDLDVGYIYVGVKHNYQDWAMQVWSQKDKVIALPGDTIKVKKRGGFDLFEKSDREKKITHISRNRKFMVQDVIEDNQGRVIYFVKYRNKEGYILAGDVQDLSFAQNWNELQ